MDLWELLYPKRCLLCYELLDVREREGDLCHHCAENQPRVTEARCRKCGKALADPGGEYCEECRTRAHRFEYGRVLFRYTSEVQGAIVRFKYKNQRSYARWFGREIALAFAEDIRGMDAAVLVPVPLYKRKERQRGFNQAALLAEVIGEYTGLPVLPLLERRRSTRAQKELGYEERLRNLQESFAVKEEWRVRYRLPARVILVDDIFTTGSTMDACAAVLKAAGVKRVYFLAIAGPLA